MRDTATSFALRAEKSVQMDSIGSGDIRALCSELLGLCTAVEGIKGRRSDSEAPIEHHIKNHGDGLPYLGLGRA